MTVRTEERHHIVARAQLPDRRQQLQQVVGRLYHAVADREASGLDGELFAARPGQQQNRRVECGGLQVTEHRRHVDPVLRRIQHEQIGRARLQRGHHAGDIARSDAYVRGTSREVGDGVRRVTKPEETDRFVHLCGGLRLHEPLFGSAGSLHESL